MTSTTWKTTGGRSVLRTTLLALVAGVVLAQPAMAGRVEELVRIHMEALGGRERIEALKAMRAFGEVIAGGQRMKFTLIAARPDRIRLETERGARSLVQAYDGHEPPWQFDTGQWPPHYEEIPAASAKVFVADADFDDPLVAGAARGYSIDYAGEVEIEGRKLIRLLVTRNLTETFSLLLDPDTYFIVRRVEMRKDAFGTTVTVTTVYSDYRPVDGVLVPHLIGLFTDDKAVQQTKIERIEANPDIAADTFSRPKTTP